MGHGQPPFISAVSIGHGSMQSSEPANRPMRLILVSSPFSTKEETRAQRG